MKADGAQTSPSTSRRDVLLGVVAGLVLLASPQARAGVTLQQAQLALDAYHTRSLPDSVSPEDKERLKQIASLIRAGNTARAEKQWERFCEGYFTSSNAAHADRLRLWVLRRSYERSGDPVAVTLDEWEDLTIVGDDQQLANIDLQNMLQRQQQTLQLISNLSKVLQDSALASIRKIGG